MFDKKTCERCGKQYRVRTASEERGKHYCPDCCKHCSMCGKKLPMARWFGQSSSVTTALFTPMIIARQEYREKPWIGSGLCEECYGIKAKKEEEEQRILKEAQLRQAQEVLETPAVWTCEYCQTVNRGNFCSYCGASRKKVK